MELTQLIQHPEEMDKETLYDLRSLLALHPYYQTVRLLLLQNLYILHDQSFNEELRRAAIYITDRKVIFKMVEAAHYQFNHPSSSKDAEEEQPTDQATTSGEDRTTTLIDNFLDSIPPESEEEQKKKKHRQPTPADAAVDYVSYLMANESDEEKQAESKSAPKMKGQELIDSFLDDGGGFHLQTEEEENTDNPGISSETGESQPIVQGDGQKQKEEEEIIDEGYFTETLARIYIKQGRYEKALEIIKRLYLNYPKKSAYFVDQIRFLEKLIINNNKK
ncbi:tetratricopeptide repeat protein [Prevotella cerevisiae]|uniref:Tetratricopeptide repeat protein n=1 Tax=Segatella cerevisiae TaxID=2053716 RepID=A0ABT1BV91_9BACT|nr:tetratricopeptide repeat protein [Segatella cerevisiae]MCO6024986.1 tetratricopeptide repeat protein [Segatella cerevisiae]